MKKSRKSGTFAIAALAAVTVVVLVFWRPAASEAVYPLERACGWLSRHVGVRAAGMFRGAAVAAENAKLRREVGALRLRAGDLERLERENARLRQALHYAPSRQGVWIAAPVIARGLGASGDGAMLRIGKGAGEGLRSGAVVAVGAGLVGRIGSVTPHTATVVPVTDPSSRVACEVVVPQGGAPVRGVLCGGDEDALSMRHLTEESAVPEAALVRTSGLGGVFPAGLNVGRVRGERTDALGRRSEIVVESFVDFSSLEDVFVEVEAKAGK